MTFHRIACGLLERRVSDHHDRGQAVHPQVRGRPEEGAHHQGHAEAGQGRILQVSVFLKTTFLKVIHDHFYSSRTANLMNGFQMNGRVVDPQKQSVIVELLLMKKTQARLQQKCVRSTFEIL